MIAQMVALGMFAQAPDLGDIVTPQSRIITVQREGDRASVPVAAATMDPSDRQDFVISLTQLLEDGETFDTIAFTVAPESVLLGFTVLSQAPHAPVEISDDQVRIWVEIDPAAQGNAAWSGKGTVCRIEFNATTDLTRQWQRSVGIRIVQK